jgi:hypothetical protein
MLKDGKIPRSKGFDHFQVPNRGIVVMDWKSIVWQGMVMLLRKKLPTLSMANIATAYTNGC